MSRKKPLPTKTQLLPLHVHTSYSASLHPNDPADSTSNTILFLSLQRFLHFIQQTDTPNWGIQLPMQIRLLNTIALMKQKKNLTFWKLKLIPAGLVDISYALKMCQQTWLMESTQIFMDKHEEYDRPEMQKRLVIKHNANQRYATSGVTSFLFQEKGKIHNLPTQEFVVRNNMGCGSTIGPIRASGAGICTVDCGIAQLSMHSVREICGKEDIDIAHKYFKAFYQTFSSIYRKLIVDS